MKKSDNLLLRGISEVVSEKELDQKIRKGKPLRIKLGVDPTSPDLHLGHTVVLNKLKQFQEMGHITVFIIGDMTASIGDPSGRNETRPRISQPQIEENTKTYLDQVYKILDPERTEVRKNSEWLKAVFNPEKVFEEGSIFTTLMSRATVQQILQREDFAQRIKIGNPITFLEMLYPLFQGYDSVAVRADVEIGGNDQLFNLLMGRELQRDFGQEPQVILTLPLLVGTDGVKKMSKSYQNHIALNDEPKEMFGKVMSLSDKLMWSYYELLTEENLAEIKKIHPKEAKMKLASLLIGQYHHKEAAVKAREEFENIFSKKDLPDDMEEYTSSKDKWLLSHLLFESGLSPSKKESKRLIENGGVRMNGKQIENDHEILIQEPFILQVGRRKFKRITQK